MSRAYPCARQRRLRLPLAVEPQLERHQVLELLYDLAAAVAVARPRDPLPFFLDFLRASQNIKFCPRIMLLPSEEVSRSFSDVAAIMANMAGLELLTREDLVWGGVLSSDGVARPPSEQEEEEAEVAEEEEEEEEQEEEEEEDHEKETSEAKVEAEAVVLAAAAAAADAAEADPRRAVGSLLVEGPLAEAVAAVTAARSTLSHAIDAALAGADAGAAAEGAGDAGPAEEASSTHTPSSDGCVAALEAAAGAAGRPMRCWGCARARAAVAGGWLHAARRQARGWLLADVPASRAEAEALRRAGLLPTHLLQMRELLCPSHYEPPRVETTVAPPAVAAETGLTSSVEWAAERSRASCVEPQAEALAAAHAVAQQHAEARERAVAAAAAAAVAATEAAEARVSAAPWSPPTAGGLLATPEAVAVAEVAAEAVAAAVTAAAAEAEAKAEAAAREAAAVARAAAAAAVADAKAAAAATAAAAGVCVRTHRHERARRQGPLLDEARTDTEGVLAVFRHTPLVRVVAVRGGEHEQMALAALGQAFARRPPRGHSWVPRVALVAPECAGARWHQQRLSYQFGLCPVDFLTLLREEPRPPQTSVERLSWSLPAARAAQIVARRLAERDCVLSGWVLVGFPRDAEDLRHLDATAFPPNRVFLFNNSVEWCLRHAQGGALVRRARQASGGCRGPHAQAQLPAHEPSVRELVAAARLLGARGLPLLRDSLGYARRLRGLRALCQSSATAVDGERGRALVYHQLRAALAQAAPPAPPRLGAPRRPSGQQRARFPSELPRARSPSSPRSPVGAASPRAASAAPSAATVRSVLAAAQTPGEDADEDDDDRVLGASLVQQ